MGNQRITYTVLYPFSNRKERLCPYRENQNAGVRVEEEKKKKYGGEGEEARRAGYRSTQFKPQGCEYGAYLSTALELLQLLVSQQADNLHQKQLRSFFFFWSF